ncbi:MAG: hypothetical protein U0930_04175 [Pirellulales bacterium]
MSQTRILQFTILATCLLGCSNSLPAPANSEIAVESLKKALSAWQSGASAESLQPMSPPIYFNDQLWKNGHQLSNFTMDEGSANGQGWNCEATLEVQIDGKQKKVKVNYQIDTSPVIVIVQQP